MSAAGRGRGREAAVRRLHDDAGIVVMELVLTVCMWLFPISILVVSLPTWVERQSLGRLAAQEAAREVVLADSWSAGAAQAQQVVNQLALNHDVDPGDLALELGGSLARGTTVTATVTVQVPALTVPFVAEAPGFSLSFTAAEAVDQYRSIP